VETALVEALTAPAAGQPAGARVPYGPSPADLEAEDRLRARLADPAWLWRR
jgi:hypothetical protein